MKTMHRYLATLVAALQLASAASPGPVEIVEVNQRTHKARAKDNFEVHTGIGQYLRVNYTVSMKKDWLKKLSTYYLPRLEIIDKGIPTSSIPVQRRDSKDGSQYLHFELAPDLVSRCVLVFVEMTSETTRIEYRVDLYSYTKEGAKKRRPLLDELVKVEFPENGYQYTLAEVAKGIKIEYKIVIDEDVPGVTPMRFGPSFAEPPGPSGLYPREAIYGNGNSYCLFDSGLGQPPKEPVKTLKKGTYVHSFEWDGRNWSGPSDTGMPKGKAFPAGTYDLTVVFQGRRETDIGQVPYEITRKTKLVLKSSGEPGPLNSAADARKAFRSEFEAYLKKLPEGARQYWRKRLDKLYDKQPWSVERQSFADAWKRVDGTLTEKERKSQIRLGTLDGLRTAKGDCWAISYLADFDSIMGYLDARTGRLVFLWSPPEG